MSHATLTISNGEKHSIDEESFTFERHFGRGEVKAGVIAPGESLTERHNVPNCQASFSLAPEEKSTWQDLSIEGATLTFRTAAEVHVIKSARLTDVEKGEIGPVITVEGFCD